MDRRNKGTGTTTAVAFKLLTVALGIANIDKEKKHIHKAPCNGRI